VGNNNTAKANPLDLVYSIAVTDGGGIIGTLAPAVGSTLTPGSSQDHVVNFDTTSLAPGDYTATITITDTNSQAVPVSGTVTVDLKVLAKPVIAATPAALTPTASFGYNTPDETFVLKNDNAAAINPADLAGYTAAVAYTSAESGWIGSVSPAGGSLASGAEATITVAFAAAALPVGVHTATITISDDAGDAASATVGVTLTVKPTYSVSVTWAGTGGGTVDVEGVAIQPESPFTATSVSGNAAGPTTITNHPAEEGDVIRLTATPAGSPSPGSIFKQWSDGELTEIHPDITVTGNLSLVVTFNQQWQVFR
jgi:hypothetical protein